MKIRDFFHNISGMGREIPTSEAGPRHHTIYDLVQAHIQHEDFLEADSLQRSWALINYGY
jgi:hypothetical protein